MKILLTGVTGYIGKRLLPILHAQGHEVLCAVRDKKRFDKRLLQDNISLLEVDFLKSETLGVSLEHLLLPQLFLCYISHLQTIEQFSAVCHCGESFDQRNC
jgi:nucleoside-diphosphate-sugar epimerase